MTAPSMAAQTAFPAKLISMQGQGSSKPVFGLRVIAIYKFCKTVLAIGIAWGLFRLVHADLQSVSDRVIALFHVKAEFHLVQNLQEKFTDLSPHELRLGGFDALVCALLFAAEGLGLWWEKRWAEWLVIINSGILVPFEVMGLLHHPDWLHLLVLAVNLIIIAYIAKVVWKNRKKHVR
jgi:uncharacterized membrane protein (DUF2068 family)